MSRTGDVGYGDSYGWGTSPLERNQPHVQEFVGVAVQGSIPEMMAGGQYDYKNKNIPKVFTRTDPRPQVDMALVHFNKRMTSKQVEEWLLAEQAQGRMIGYELARIEHLLAIGMDQRFASMQRNFPMIALGSSAEVEGKRKVPLLHGFRGERSLYLDFWDHEWDDGCRFLFVRTGSA